MTPFPDYKEIHMERSFFEWIIYLIQEYWPYFVQGALLTLAIAFWGTVLGYVLGFFMGIVQSTPNPKEGFFLKRWFLIILKAVCKIFVEVFRCTPMMVQAMVIYFGLKQFGEGLTPFMAAVLVTLLNTGAYMAETVRGGIISIDKGQLEGAKALGMSHFTTMFSVILPQAFRNIFPEMVNQYLTNLKMTSVLNVIGVAELYFVTKTAAGTYYRYFEAYVICGLIYLVLCLFFTRLFALLEKKLAGRNDYELAAEYMDAE